MAETHVVTGAFGYSGSYIARRLLDRGHSVRTLTNSPDRANQFGGAIPAFPYHFDRPDELAATLHDADVLYNTYWVRFNYTTFRHSVAVDNTLTLFEAARAAGVRRIVHVSITNPSLDSPLEYFRGKAVLESALQDTGIPYAILRPTVLFGPEDILINNIAWFLRHFPIFGVFGDGKYRLQPIYVDDLAALAVEQGASREDAVIDAIGPESFTYEELVRAIGTAIGCARPLVHVPPAVGYAVGRIVGALTGDVVVTREEIDGLMQGLLCTGSPPAGPTRLTEWLSANAASVGRHYASELARRRNRTAAYPNV